MSRLQINENWKIESDSDQIILLQRKVSEKSERFPNGNETWNPTYHGNVPQAFRSLINKEVNATGLESLRHMSECIEELYKLVESIKVVTLEKVVTKNVISFAEVEKIPEEVEEIEEG